MAAEPLLRIEDVHAGYGEIEVLRGVSAQVAAGEIVSIIGANGAGKSTLLRTVFGMVRPSRGRIRLGGDEIAGESPVRVLRRSDQPHTLEARGSYAPPAHYTFAGETCDTQRFLAETDTVGLLVAHGVTTVREHLF